MFSFLAIFLFLTDVLFFFKACLLSDFFRDFPWEQPSIQFLGPLPLFLPSEVEESRFFVVTPAQ